MDSIYLPKKRATAMLTKGHSGQTGKRQSAEDQIPEAISWSPADFLMWKGKLRHVGRVIFEQQMI